MRQGALQYIGLRLEVEVQAQGSVTGTCHVLIYINTEGTAFS